MCTHLCQFCLHSCIYVLADHVGIYAILPGSDHACVLTCVIFVYTVVYMSWLTVLEYMPYCSAWIIYCMCTHLCHFCLHSCIYVLADRVGIYAILPGSDHVCVLTCVIFVYTVVYMSWLTMLEYMPYCSAQIMYVYSLVSFLSTQLYICPG